MATFTTEMLEQVKAGTLSVADCAALLAADSPKGALRLKIGDKGGVVVSGLNARFPVTLYADQWGRLFDFVPEIKAFIEANRAKLSFKAPKLAAA